MTVHGIDLSNWTGEVTPAWAAALKAAGYVHAVVRAGLERPDMADLTRQQAPVLQAAGLSTSAYVWCYGNQNPITIADNAAALLRPLGIGWAHMDAEDVASFKDLPNQQSIDWMRRLHDELTAAKQFVSIYTAAWCYGPMFGNLPGLGDIPLWVAEYDNIPDPAIWTRFADFTTAFGKQWLGSGGPNAPTAGKMLDLDVFIDGEWWAGSNFPPQPAPPPDPCADKVKHLQDQIVTLGQDNQRLSGIVGAVRQAVA